MESENLFPLPPPSRWHQYFRGVFPFCWWLTVDPSVIKNSDLDLVHSVFVLSDVFNLFFCFYFQKHQTNSASEYNHKCGAHPVVSKEMHTWGRLGGIEFLRFGPWGMERFRRDYPADHTTQTTKCFLFLFPSYPSIWRLANSLFRALHLSTSHFI